MSDHPGSHPPHALHQKLGVLDIWALAVGIVVCGQYFAWNFGLMENGPIALMIASLLVCLLFLCWVLTLAELSVAMPDAGGPLAFGEKAGGRPLGFLMAWSMLLECLFGMIATSMATGWYLAQWWNPAAPQTETGFILIGGLAPIALFLGLQAMGVREQARVLVWMTYAALGGIILVWLATLPHFNLRRILIEPALWQKGWKGVLDATPAALWWLIIIEGAALAAAETVSPRRTIPRGLVLGMVTVIGMIACTLLLSCGAVPWEEINDEYTLAQVMRLVLQGQNPWLWHLFCLLALFGLLASYHGLLYGTSRQLYALGKTGYLPPFLGKLHPTRRTPVNALIVCSLVAAGVVIASPWAKDPIMKAVYIAGITSMIWYILAMVCLALLRRRSPVIFSNYQAPLAKTLPVVVLVYSGFALVAFGGTEDAIWTLKQTLVLYGVGCLIFVLVGLFSKKTPVQSRHHQAEALGQPSVSGSAPWLEMTTRLILWLTLLVPFWMVGASYWPNWFRFASDETEALLVAGLLAVALALVSWVAWKNTRQVMGNSKGPSRIPEQAVP